MSRDEESRIRLKPGRIRGDGVATTTFFTEVRKVSRQRHGEE
ncbi:hypothetical protein GCM10007874_73000 [Labrys miyagiensis]|uniref:Uncharacterized protein n=1 Tax=Labrys miyagiensis TaxID=346912 RepID=A0ABQ6CWT7_9HYPH|nr:hypothetical protein [Labrys miyagiensis]GLS24278.1 hypothetical protein GCM10007874_73000 [Labrys miyagiensis]